MPHKIPPLFIALCFLVTTTFAQKLDHVLGEVLVRLHPEADVHTLVDEYTFFKGYPTALTAKEQVSKHMDIWLLSFDHTKVDEFSFLDQLTRNTTVHSAQRNHLLTWRSKIPNDPIFNEQWQYVNTGQGGGVVGADIDADLAWNVTTGGKTANGDEIVVCVVDNGLDPNHRDFEDNIWINHGEIPDNNIDDDGNGYIDDYQGYNTATNSDDIDDLNWHGTPVAGIIGAKGNNRIGVTGINWDVKLMIVVGGTGVESEVIEAYSYSLEMRKRYNATNGQEGAFVVATNSSWGVDEGQPADAPLWCAFYDTLGAHGILNMGATANANLNIDETGDLPTACPSDYLVAVTNMDRSDRKITEAGYGVERIDLGAFGQGTYTVADMDDYGGFGGTSGATPHVTGAVALLYAAPCPSIADLAIADPAAAALLMRQYILEGVTPLSALEGLTATGGRLNINNSMQLLMDNCEGCLPAFSFDLESVVDTMATISWTESDSIVSRVLRYRVSETSTWDTITSAAPPFALSNLTGCTDYELQVQTSCADTTAIWSNIYRFRTDGCCDQPVDLAIVSATVGETDALVVNWQTVLAATAYNVEFRPHPDSAWTNYTIEQPPLAIPELANCSTYDLRIESQCTADSVSGFSSVRNLSSTCNCLTPTILDTLQVDENSINITWEDVPDAANYTLRYKILGQGGWTRIDTSVNQLQIDGLESCTNYRFQVRSLCNIRNSQYSGAIDQKTACVNNTTSLASLESIELAPNPFTDELHLSMQLMQPTPISITLWDSQGKLIRQMPFLDGKSGNNQWQIDDLSTLSQGIYWLRIQTDRGTTVRKIVHTTR